MHRLALLLLIVASCLSCSTDPASACLTCDGDDCTSCAPGFGLSSEDGILICKACLGKQKTSVDGKTCLGACLDRQFLSTDGKACLSQCAIGDTYKHRNRQCASQCGAGEFSSNLTGCVICASNCLECSSASRCKTCRYGFKRLDRYSINICVRNCSIYNMREDANRGCVSVCNSTTSLNDINNVCESNWALILACMSAYLLVFA